MRCAVMQPTYFPWAGYFNLIGSVDVFVFLDDAQYERGTWQNRNRVLLNGVPHWLTVPVVRERLGDAINECETDDRHSWRRKHLALLHQVYGKHPFGSDILALSERFVGDEKITRLAALNLQIVSEICAKFGIKTRMLRSSELDIRGSRSERLAKICGLLDCDEYLSPPGALPYLTEDRFCELTKVKLLINEYESKAYAQRGSELFVSHLSVIDVVANLGWDGAATYVSRNSETRLITFCPS